MSFHACFLPEEFFHVLTAYPGLFCYSHLCPDFSVDLFIIVSSFKLVSLFLQVSALVTKIKDIRGNLELPLTTLFVEKFYRGVCYRLVEVGDHVVPISTVIYQRGKWCKSATYCCLESTHHREIIQLLEVKPDFGCVGFLDFKESRHHYVMVASNVCTRERSGSDSSDT